MSKAFLRHTFTKNIFDIVNHAYQILIFIHFHYTKMYLLPLYVMAKGPMGFGQGELKKLHSHFFEIKRGVKQGDLHFLIYI